MNLQQRKFAEILADQLEEHGHDDVTWLDVLDVLASCGLKLASDPTGAAGAAYYRSVAEQGVPE